MIFYSKIKIYTKIKQNKTKINKKINPISLLTSPNGAKKAQQHFKNTNNYILIKKKKKLKILNNYIIYIFIIIIIKI